MFQSPEGDSLFFYPYVSDREVQEFYRFSPPKGIHCFSTCSDPACWDKFMADVVSVPRRGFIVFLRLSSEDKPMGGHMGFSPPKGIHCFSTRVEQLVVEGKVEEA